MKRGLSFLLALIVLVGCGRQSEGELQPQLAGIQQGAESYLLGDANKDGVVDVLDGSQVLAAGKFGTGAKATWEEGDFNLDGVVNSTDINLLNFNYGKKTGDPTGRYRK